MVQPTGFRKGRRWARLLASVWSSRGAPEPLTNPRFPREELLQCLLLRTAEQDICCPLFESVAGCQRCSGPADEAARPVLSFFGAVGNAGARINSLSGRAFERYEAVSVALVEVEYDIFENLSPPNPARRYHVYHSMDLNFRLQANSKAVDAGVVLPTINDGFTGKAPDLGALELNQKEPHYGPRWITWKPFYR